MAIADKIRKMGNLDVTFDDSVSQNARKRFAAIPDSNATWDQAHQQWLARQPKKKVYNSPTAGLLTKDNAQGMGWQQRSELNAKILEGRNKLSERSMINRQSGADTATITRAKLAERDMINKQSGADTAAVIDARLAERKMINEQSGKDIAATNRNRLDVADLQGANAFNITQAENSSREGIKNKELAEAIRQYNSSRLDKRTDTMLNSGVDETTLQDQVVNAQNAINLQDKMVSNPSAAAKIAAESVMADMTPDQRIQWIMSDPKLRIIYADELKANSANK